jgi:bifunctional non-homologous end joining protein LigD
MGLRVLSPMLATTRPPTEPAEWVFEPKLDGWRCLVYVDATVTVRTRTARDITANVPHLQGLAGLGRRVVLDGELVADAGRARDFYQVGSRLRSNGATGETTFCAFDVLVLDGENVCKWSYCERRGALEALGLLGPGWCTIRALDAGPRELLEACAALGVEGVVAKRADSPYRPGVRSVDWLKLKTAEWKSAHAPTRHPR